LIYNSYENNKTCKRQLPSDTKRLFYCRKRYNCRGSSLGSECSVWFNAVIRGDVHYIKIGNKVNIQDGAVIHATYLKSPTNIGNNVSIGHNALVHGCTIHDNVLIGMGSIIMDDCVIESNSIIAAGAVVTKNNTCRKWKYLCRNTC